MKNLAFVAALFMAGIFVSSCEKEEETETTVAAMISKKWIAEYVYSKPDTMEMTEYFNGSTFDFRSNGLALVITDSTGETDTSFWKLNAKNDTVHICYDSAMTDCDPYYIMRINATQFWVEDEEIELHLKPKP